MFSLQTEVSSKTFSKSMMRDPWLLTYICKMPRADVWLLDQAMPRPAWHLVRTPIDAYVPPVGPGGARQTKGPLKELGEARLPYPGLASPSINDIALIPTPRRRWLILHPKPHPA